jgi:hypothetical protein
VGKFIDLAGQRFGRLVVIERIENDKSKNARWICLCDCGNETIVVTRDLRSGHTQSCGCLNRDKITTHGHCKGGKKSPTYGSWHDMMQRCYNPNCREYPNYGGRDIRVCLRWHIFENFLEDMGECSNGLELERVDVNGHYELENCKWDTEKNQARNRRNNVILTLNGVSHCASEWAEILGWRLNILLWRKKHDWSDEEILTTPPGQKRKKGASL